MRIIHRLMVLSVTCCWLYTALATAQQPTPPKPQPPSTPQSQKEPEQDKGHIETIDTEEVLLDVAVVDQTGRPIEGLVKEDFTVFEDKVKQPLESVRRTVVPLSLGIVIDTSGSMRTKLQAVSDAALGLIKQMKEGDEAFVAQFKMEAELVRDFTRDKRDLEDGLNDLYTGGGTALLDAIVASADFAQANGKLRKKALVVITDGFDKNSSLKEKEVVKAMQEDDVQVYFVGIIEESEQGFSMWGNSGKKAKNLLIRLAEDSGGRAFFPKDARDVAAVMTEISHDLRSQYLVSYSPTNEKKDGTFRTIKVVVAPKDNRKLIVRTRQGYTARRTNATNTEPKLKKSE